MRIEKKVLKRIAWNGILVFAGSFITGMAYTLFIIPHHFVPGGVSGVAIILNYFFRLPVGVQIIVFNIPIFLLGMKVMGRRSALAGMAGMVLSSLLIDFCSEVFGPRVLHISSGGATGDKILAAIYGGVMLGIGIGVIFRGRSSTGGSDVIGQILSKYTGMSVGFGILIVDFLVISASGAAFGDFEAPLYGYIVLFLSSRVIDMILEGWNYSKLVIITSTRIREIEEFILYNLERSGTALKSRSLYLNREGEMILTVIHRKQLAELRHFIKQTDPEAFVVINDTYAVLGKGFKANLL